MSAWQAIALHLANQNAGTVRGGAVNCRKANMALHNSSCILTAKFERKPPDSCRKKSHKLITQKLWLGGDG